MQTLVFSYGPKYPCCSGLRRGRPLQRPPARARVEVAPDGARGAPLPGRTPRTRRGSASAMAPPQHKCLNMIRKEVSLVSFVRLLGCEPHMAHGPRRRAWASASSPGCRRARPAARGRKARRGRGSPGGGGARPGSRPAARAACPGAEVSCGSSAWREG